MLVIRNITLLITSIQKRAVVAISFLLIILAMLLPTVWANEPNEMFILRSSQTAPEEVVMQIEHYAKDKKWNYLGAHKVKKGQVWLVKICIKAAGKALWKAGPHVSAMLPCGNISVYKEKGMTQISLLHPRFMHMIYPDPNVQNAVDISTPLLIGMMNDIGD